MEKKLLSKEWIRSKYNMFIDELHIELEMILFKWWNKSLLQNRLANQKVKTLNYIPTNRIYILYI